ncbi:acyltransferase family protein [Ferruginibacter sp. SUN002]|uniref:acyltransferase family protein n=1 Tax=Ferruginibacter sp. SUN002 TaxID=2937789 RepID=UPI003D365508
MRVDQITFTRFLAAISIVVYHFGDTIYPFSLDSISFLFKQANVGVSFFFILSGYVMILAYGSKNKIGVGEFLKNRFARVYPIYLFAIALFFIYLKVESLWIDHKGILLNILTIQSWIPGEALSFNRPGWTLSVEVLFYISFPFLFNYIYKKYDYKKLVVPILLFWILSQVLLHIGTYSGFYGGFPSKSHDLLYYFPLMHLNEFLIGNLAGLFFVNKLSNTKKNVDVYIILTSILFVLWLKYNSILILHDGVLNIIFVPLIFLFSINNGFITKLFSKRIFVFLGEISYCIYILQIPVYWWTLKALAKLNITDQANIFYIFLIVLIIVSAICYSFIEEPLRNKIKNIGSKKTS